MATMNRRHAVLNLVALPFLCGTSIAAAPKPYKVSLISGNQVAGQWQAGILIELEPGWKTYWRVPGSAGIPPEFDWAGSENIGSMEILMPLPTRFHDASGDGIGYHDKVVFPVNIKPASPDKKVRVNLNIFFAVCNAVCIPAKAQLELLATATRQNPVLKNWTDRVPVPGNEVASARTEMYKSEPMLALKLLRPVNDIFVETAGQIYFGKPLFDVVSGEAWLPLGNVNSADPLKNLALKLTFATGNSGIEQSITVN